MFSALIGAGMISVTSCADYDADMAILEGSIIDITDNMTLEDGTKVTFQEMQDAINDLKKQIEGMKSCECEGVDERIQKAIQDALSKLNYTTPEDVAAAIDAAITAINPGLTEEQVNALINQYHATHKDCQCGDIETLIKNYLEKNKYVTEAQAEAIAQKYHDEHPNSSLTTEDVNNLIATYIANQLLDEGTIKKAIDAAIQKALAEFVGCTCKPLTKEDIEAIIEQYRKDHPCYTKEEIETIIKNCQTIKDLQTAQSTIESYLGTYDLTKGTVEQRLEALEAAADVAAEALARTNDLTLSIVTLSTRLFEIAKDAADAKAKAENALERIEILEKYFDGYQQDKGMLEKRLSDLEKVFDDYKKIEDECTDKCKATMDTKIGELRGAYTGTLEQLDSRLKAVEDALKDLTDRVTKVENALAHLVTNIELQGSVNPAFGYFALPVGLTSNVLIAYYGDNLNGNFDFPTLGSKNLVYKEEANWITPADAARIGLFDNTEEIESGKIVGGTGNAGKLYLTVNPSSVDFDGIEFKLVNSLGEESPVTLGALQHSTDKLTFGQTRAANNGFYEATATVTEENVNKASFKINSQLTDALKEVAKKKGSANISNLSQAIYNSFDGFLDAYAVQATWKDSEGAEHTTTSRYGIAATAIQPLGYGTLYGQSFKLPTITPLSERNIDLNDYIKIPEFNFDFSSLDVDQFKPENIKVEIHFSDVWVEADGSIWTNVHMTEYIKNDGELSSSPDKKVEEKFCLVDATGTFHGPVYPDGINPGLTPDQYKAVNAMIALIVEDRAQVWSAQLQEGFTKQMSEKLGDLVKDVNKVIEDVSSSLQGNLNGKLQDMIDNANNKLNSLLGKTDPFFKSFNSLIEELNDNFFGNGNPNLRLQGHVFYEDAKGYLHPMSTSKAMPTVFTGSGSIELNLTSYTKEILAPAYKKFVAVTNVYKDGKNADTDAALMNALKHANGVEGFNEVFDGDRYAVAFDPDHSLNGAVYEIVYSSVDFAGNISQRKYYVKVN